MKNLINKIEKADKRTSKGYKYGRPTLMLTKAGKLNKLYSNALTNSVFKENKIYPTSWSGSGRHINLTDNSFYITNLLDALGYKYTTGNDAPRGGKSGDFIKISSVAMKALKTVAAL